MPNESTKPKEHHGSCNAIFSHSPAAFSADNVLFAERAIREGCPTFFTDLPTTSKRSTTPVSYKFKKQDESPMRQGNRSDSQASSLVRSKSAISPKQDFGLSTRSHSEEKLKMSSRVGSSSRLSGDKTPVTHFCTPKRTNGSRALLSTSCGTPIKRYFSDRSLPQATPEYYTRVQMETPKPKQDMGIDEQSEGESSNLTVGIRVRPLNIKEVNEPKIFPVVQINGQSITVDCESSQHTFSYDHCFVSHLDACTPGHASQETVFNTMVLPLVQSAFEGYNVCLFAYGQTGSGKSYSMMGTEQTQVQTTFLGAEAGIVPRFCQEILSRSSKNTRVVTTVDISYFEIYNEKIHDLLASNGVGNKRAPLKVREHPLIGPYVVDLSQRGIKNYEDLQAWLKVGNSQRATAATGMNETSSRSHSIFSIVLTQTRQNGPSNESNNADEGDSSRRSKINLVDLAGSERLSQTCASGDRLREGVSINKSLLILGKVIGCLAENATNKKHGFVPYRESVLTWLLKESLGGNSRTAMLGTVSPANVHLEETLATLRYACQARAIVNRIRINEDPHDRIIRELKAEVLRLRGVREGYEKQLGVPPRRLLDLGNKTVESEIGTEAGSETLEEMRIKQKEIDALREQLRKTEQELALTQMSRGEKLQEAQLKKEAELKHLRRRGIAVEFDLGEKSSQPCLVNLAADPMLSGTLLYLIPPGVVRVGRCTNPRFEQPEIVLEGPLVRQLHCTIENKNGKVILSPEEEADTFVNGQRVAGRTLLNHGDRLVIGGNHYFKISNPLEEQGATHVSVQPVDFEFAHQEILRIQEEKLRTELEESKHKAIKELENAKREIEAQLGSQRFTFEREIQALGSTVEQQKLALEETNRKKMELELERELLATQLETNDRIRKIQLEESKSTVSPYKTNFLKDVEDLLNETTAGAEIALNLKSSADAMETGGVSLHEMLLLVREATERCREVGINYEFYQQTTIVDKELQRVIRVRDKDRKVETLWQPMRFLDWVHRLRDFDIEDSIKELRDSEDDWELYDDSDFTQDSLNNSRISINITPVKKQLNESLHQLSMDSSILECSIADQTAESVISKRRDDILQCLLQMELAARTLGKLCHFYESREVSGQVTKSLDQVHSIIDSLKSTLESKNSNETTNCSASSNTSGLNNTVIENSENVVSTSSLNNSAKHVPRWDASPTRPNLKSGCPVLQNGTAKSVRFDVN
ncbi:kinesin-like protein KIF14 [Orussus abietinus]|uniref:kinesin-like protein KIF14 n=1 Tax=Orussus abietinus TaxID=222816 RepID=UPI000626E92E|nr:kinesin-like protein KIF14 [Orussus abietinus]